MCRLEAASPGVELQDLKSLAKQLDVLLAELDVAGGDPKAQLDKASEAEREAEAKAVQLVRDAAERGLVKGFGRGQQVPKRLYTIADLRLNGIETTQLLSPTDNSLNTVRNAAQAAALAALASFSIVTHPDVSVVIELVLSVAFVLVTDQIVNRGGGEALVVDTLGRALLPGFARRVALHEAGHLLVAYLVGVLPMCYSLSMLDAFRRYGIQDRRFLQAGTQICYNELGLDGTSCKSSNVDKFTCICVAGVVTESLRFGQAEGGLSDVQQLDRLFSVLGFTQLKADGEVRWAVLNVATLLRRHEALQDRLADAMLAGVSVGELVIMIEEALGPDDLAPAP